jgi:hypothetical protein
MEDYLRKLDMLPEYMREGMQQWIERGFATGHFLCAVLRNDLRGAIERADEENVRRLKDYVVYLYNYAPTGCWGSPARFDDWEAKGGLFGIQRAAEAREGAAS